MRRNDGVDLAGSVLRQNDGVGLGGSVLRRNGGVDLGGSVLRRNDGVGLGGSVLRRNDEIAVWRNGGENLPNSLVSLIKVHFTIVAKPVSDQFNVYRVSL